MAAIAAEAITHGRVEGAARNLEQERRRADEEARLERERAEAVANSPEVLADAQGRGIPLMWSPR